MSEQQDVAGTPALAVVTDVADARVAQPAQRTTDRMPDAPAFRRALLVDLTGVTLLATVALRSALATVPPRRTSTRPAAEPGPLARSGGLAAVAAVAALGVALAGLALGGLAPAGPDAARAAPGAATPGLAAARRLVLAGAALNTSGSLATAATHRRQPPVVAPALALLLGGNLLSGAYLRASRG